MEEVEHRAAASLGADGEHEGDEVERDGDGENGN